MQDCFHSQHYIWCFPLSLKPAPSPQAIACLPGVQREDLDVRFWRRQRRLEPSNSDVILRTVLAQSIRIATINSHHFPTNSPGEDETIPKRCWLSASDLPLPSCCGGSWNCFGSKSTRREGWFIFVKFLILAFIWFDHTCQSTSQSQSTPTMMNANHCGNMRAFCVYSLESSICSEMKFNCLQWGVQSLGQFPFNMESAASCIEDLADNILGRYPLLDVSLWGAHFDWISHQSRLHLVSSQVFLKWACNWSRRSAPASGWWTRFGSCTLEWIEDLFNSGTSCGNGIDCDSDLN